MSTFPIFTPEAFPGTLEGWNVEEGMAVSQGDVVARLIVNNELVEIEAIETGILHWLIGHEEGAFFAPKTIIGELITNAIEYQAAASYATYFGGTTMPTPPRNVLLDDFRRIIRQDVPGIVQSVVKSEVPAIVRTEIKPLEDKLEEILKRLPPQP